MFLLSQAERIDKHGDLSPTCQPAEQIPASKSQVLRPGLGLQFQPVRGARIHLRGVSTPHSTDAFCSLRNLIFLIFLLRWTRKTFYALRGYGLSGAVSLIYSRIYKDAYKLFLSAPGVRSQVDKQVKTAVADLENKIAPMGPGITRYLTVPKEGWTVEQCRSELERLSDMKRTRWEDGKVSGAVYHGGEDLLQIQTLAMEKFGVANPIHPDVFPGVRKMEAEVVAMVGGFLVT